MIQSATSDSILGIIQDDNWDVQALFEQFKLLRRIDFKAHGGDKSAYYRLLNQMVMDGLIIWRKDKSLVRAL
jgi:hypothetical protein